MNAQRVHKAIGEYVSREVHGEFRDWTSAIMSLPRTVRVYHLTWLLEAEVRSGGFIHFFQNFWGALGDEGASCFEELGSPELAAVVRRATAIFEKETGSGRFERRASYEIEEAVDPLLRPLDDEFYRISELADPDHLRLGYVGTHQAEFASLIGQAALE